MDSFPMLKRCWQRQWAGLGPRLQRMMKEDWPLEGRGLMARGAYAKEEALWTVRYGSTHKGWRQRPDLILLSLKQDKTDNV